MSIPQRPARSGRIVAALLCLLPLAAAGARAEIIPAAEMVRGITMTRVQCAAIPNTVWVASLGHHFCVRYYLSTAGGEGRRPVVFLQGDRFGKLNLQTRNFYETDKFKDVDTDKLEKLADSFSKSAKTTAIYLARIGVDGTSGHHSARKSLLELHLMNAALDAIKQRHGFEGFHLVGQSGGSLLIGGLMSMRDDIACAVPGSGRLTREKPLTKAAARPLDFFDPAEGIPRIAKNRSLRILLVTDRADRRVPAQRQMQFVTRLEQAGGHADQFFVKAPDENHHHVVAYARLAVSDCVHGASTEEITRHLAQFATRRAAATRK